MLQPTLMRIREAVLKEEQVPSRYTLVEDILYYKGRYVLSKASPFIAVLLREYHDSPMGGHAGELKHIQCWQRSGFGRA